MYFLCPSAVLSSAPNFIVITRPQGRGDPEIVVMAAKALDCFPLAVVTKTVVLSSS